MAKRVKPDVDPFYFHYPAGATIVTSHANGRDNAMAVAWHTAVSRDPPYYVVSISPKRFTHGLLVESGEFVVNFMPVDRGDLVALVAGCSGSDVDKFDAFDIAASPGSQVAAPILETAFASYECRVEAQHTFGDHDLFVARIVAVQWEDSFFADDGMLDLERVSPIVYLGEDRYAGAEHAVHIDREVLTRAALGD
ncbi:MAG: flavin reductase family protein [Dehalococcoidia bacterium]|jgi:flavin reductase (DIM6/NTAB) family NADH-FMN oxidoreductase RutF|nr:flavin reductase family protein [Dehalococcoidia bacterium]